MQVKLFDKDATLEFFDITAQTENGKLTLTFSVDGVLYMKANPIETKRIMTILKSAEDLMASSCNLHIQTKKEDK